MNVNLTPDELAAVRIAIRNEIVMLTRALSDWHEPETPEERAMSATGIPTIWKERLAVLTFALTKLPSIDA